jgi:predicted TIM-barrel fold metal-dependent hydrolase
MNIPVLERTVSQKLAVIDCDIHPVQRSNADLYPFLSKRWREHMDSFGGHVRQGLSSQLPYPRMMANGQRADAYPSNGGPPGCDLELMQGQHLDANGVEIGMLVSLSRGGMEERNLDYAAALSTAANDWQRDCWVKPEPRLRAGIVITAEDAAAAVAEIERRAGDASFVQVIVSPRAEEPLGRRRYWPIYEAAQAADLPIGLHPSGFSGGHPTTGAGYPTYYMQEHYAFETGMQSMLVSLVLEGVFDRFPRLKIAMIESGFAWVPAVCWRMDKHWQRMRAEVPHVKHPPSEYVREHFWFATQPIEEPENPQHLAEVIDWIGWDRLMFSSDYPHWDFDDPREVLSKIRLTQDRKAQVFGDNAKALYRL